MFQDPHIELVPALPVWVAWLLAGALLVALAIGSLSLLGKGVLQGRVAFFGALRLGIIGLFLLFLLHPLFSFVQSTPEKSSMVVLIDVSESMAQTGKAGKRLDEVRSHLTSGPLASHLNEHYQLRPFAFDQLAYPLEAGDIAGLEARGERTLYQPSLMSAWQQLQASGLRPHQVLLASDGLDQSKEDVVQLARQFGIQVHVLAPSEEARESQPELASIVDLQAARRTLLGSETAFRVLVRHDGAVERKAVLELQQDKKPVLETQIQLPRGQQESRYTLHYRPTEAGLKRFEVALRVEGKDAGKPMAISVQISDQKSEVLILEDSWRWEFKYLRRLLEDDPTYAMTAFLHRGNGAFLHFAEPDRRIKLAGYPQNRADLEGFDLIVLGDVDPDRWPRDLPSELAHVVAEEGKSLVVMAGPNLAKLAAIPAIATLLPVEFSRESGTPLEGPIAIRASAEGRASPFLSGPEGTLVQLPNLDQIYPPLRKKPGATVLVETVKQANAYGPLIVLAEQPVGRGRVLFVGSDTLWKWHSLGPQNQVKTTPYSLFWQQALRALTPARPLAKTVNLWLDPDRSRYETGQRVELLARIETALALDEPKVKAMAQMPDGKKLPLDFVVDPLEDNLFRASFDASEAGNLKIAAQVVVQGGKVVAESQAALEVIPGQDEKAPLPIDRANLTRIAAATGGQVIDPAKPETFPRSPAGEAKSAIVERKTWDLWSNYSLLILLTLLCGIDWLLRMLRGLV